jgi:CRISPR-associated protein Csm3
MSNITLKGKIIITNEIEAVTGLHIGGATGGLDIGGVDLPVLRHPVSQEPYIPGSSLRGKLRSLLDRHTPTSLNQSIGQVRIHICKTPQDYEKCPVCKVFGLPGEQTFAEPARLIVRDVYLSSDAAKELRTKKTGLPFTEVKTEVVIDRITSAAVPRQHERVPAGTVFAPCEMVFSIYTFNGSGSDTDTPLLRQVFKAMELLEDDYLGGQGSRGSGKIKFRNLTLTLKSRDYYEGRLEAKPVELGKGLTVADLRIADYTPQIKQAVGG